MSKILSYRQRLRELETWQPYLLAESGLPGPRGNIELAQAVADEGNQGLFYEFLEYCPEKAPTNTPQEFLPFCGVVGLGRLLAEGDYTHLPVLRRWASDPRWRIREGVAMALQRLGDSDMDKLIREMQAWSQGNPLEQRAAAAALCEPRLLQNPGQIEQVLAILDQITISILQPDDRKSPAFLALKKGLAYCWSVAVAALPESGKPLMEKWLRSGDKDVVWIMKQNLSKNRLLRVDPDWVQKWR
jgi:hypothetical protein